MTSAIPPFTPEESARLTKIWDRLYELYLERANGSRDGGEIENEIQALIVERDSIRPWGWNTGRNWKDDIPKDIAEKLLRE
ncbi:MAG TPA: hypothetical protein VHW90_02165 [Stellaceae bacterium]|jgi:hypothetical protein|nr:hypothetical protein [Stellaceae bacterium]